MNTHPKAQIQNYKALICQGYRWTTILLPTKEQWRRDSQADPDVNYMIKMFKNG
jgi:hypothetical protein